ncbi:MAG: DJ-1/PfpI family protein [Candidatus Eisenbacteria bacterium]
MERWNVGIVLFPDVELLDFSGPYEVFSRARSGSDAGTGSANAEPPFQVFTVARTRKTLATFGGLVVTPHYAFHDHPEIDVLVVPGGPGVGALLDEAATIEWIRGVAVSAKLVTSVCTGALLLARAGLLDGRRATTHHGAFDRLAALGDGIVVERDTRVVDDGVLTSAGVSAGIDLALHVVERHCGHAAAVETARSIEYPWEAAAVPGTANPASSATALPERSAAR